MILLPDTAGTGALHILCESFFFTLIPKNQERRPAKRVEHGFLGKRSAREELKKFILINFESL